jgi:hypothetical protein
MARTARIEAVIPAKAGIQRLGTPLDSRFRGNDVVFNGKEQQS